MAMPVTVSPAAVCVPDVKVRGPITAVLGVESSTAVSSIQLVCVIVLSVSKSAAVSVSATVMVTASETHMDAICTASAFSFAPPSLKT